MRLRGNEMLFKKIYDMIEVIYFLLKLNFCWILFTLLGIGIFGVVPATIALYDCLRMRFIKGYELPVFENFKKSYDSHFKIGNKIGIVFFSILVVLAIERSIIFSMGEFTGGVWIEIMIKIFQLVFSLFLLMFFPTFVHFKLHKTKIFLQPLIFLFIFPKETLILALITLVTFWLYVFFPILFFVLGLALPAYGVMAVMMVKYKKVEQHFIYTQS